MSWSKLETFFFFLSVFKIEQAQRHKQMTTRATDAELQCYLHIYTFLRRGGCFLTQKRVWALLCPQGAEKQKASKE